MKRFSPRQRQIFEALARGDSLKQIAEALGISANTVKHHCVQVRRKCGDAESARRAIANFYNPAFRDGQPGNQ